MQLSFDGPAGHSPGDLDFAPLRQRIRSCESIVRELAPFREPTLAEHHKLLANFGEAVTGLRDQAAKIARFKQRAYGLATPGPALPTAGLEITQLPYDRALAELLLRYDAGVRDVARLFECNRVGKVEWAGEAARFSYIEANERMGLLRWYRERHSHTHELVKAVSRSLDEPDVPMDRRTRELVAMMPGEWKRYVHIITGLQILKEQAHVGTDEHLTGFGRAVEGAKEAAGGISRSVAAAAVGTGLAAAALWHWLPAAASVAVADPCIAIGEYCLHGWDE